MSTTINRSDITKYFLMELHYKLHIADEKIKLFEKVTKLSFIVFRKR